MATTIKTTQRMLPVTPMAPLNPLPKFAARVARPPIDGGLTPGERDGFGEHIDFRALPYAMQDRYAPEPSPQPVVVIELENEHFRAQFLPQYGGRLYSLWDKRTDRESLYCNNGIILRNLALRNAWFSGGIEWNFGHFGHTYLSCQDVFFAACTDERGEPFLRMYEFERCKQLTFQVDFHLPSGATALTAHFSVHNTLPQDVPIFLWTNIAIPEQKGMHVYSGTDEVIALKLDREPEKCYYFHGQLPWLLSKGQDASDPTSMKFATEYFFQNPHQAASAFEAAQYPDGRVFAERSTGNFPYRKMFCWGTHSGGQHWQRFLAGEGSGDYLEVQGGLAPTQVHSYFLAAQSVLHITQQFTQTDAPIPQGDYAAARADIQRVVDAALPVPDLAAMDARCRALSEKPADAILHTGYGFGALEAQRDPSLLPTHLSFPRGAVDQGEAAWAALLAGKASDDYAAFMVTPPWIALMERTEPKTAALWTQLGIAYLENDRMSDAQHAWEQALRIKRLPLALRNLACLHKQAGKLDEAIAALREAVGLLTDDDALRPYAEEYLTLLTDAGQYQAAFDYYHTLSAALQSEQRMRLCVAQSAYQLGDDAFLAALFATPFTVIKEGEQTVLEIWYLQAAKLRARELGVPLTDAIVREVRQTAVIPEHLDFWMA